MREYKKRILKSRARNLRASFGHAREGHGISIRLSEIMMRENNEKI